MYVKVVTFQDYLAALIFKAADKDRLIMVHFKYLTWYSLNKVMPFTSSVTHPTTARQMTVLVIDNYPVFSIQLNTVANMSK